MRMIADRIDAPLADKGHDSDAARDTLTSRDVEAMIPARRNQIERLFNKRKN